MFGGLRMRLKRFEGRLMASQFGKTSRHHLSLSHFVLLGRDQVEVEREKERKAVEDELKMN